MHPRPAVRRPNCGEQIHRATRCWTSRRTLPTDPLDGTNNYRLAVGLFDHRLSPSALRSSPDPEYHSAGYIRQATRGLGHEAGRSNELVHSGPLHV